jgi:two-component system sensor histidine kinase YesM
VFTENSDIQRGEYILPINLLKGIKWLDINKGSNETQWYIRNNKVFCTRIFSNSDSKINLELPAVLYLSIDKDSLFQGLKDIKSGNYSLYILDKEGNIILNENNSTEKKFDEAFIKGNNYKESNGRVRIASTDYLYFKKTIEQTGWQLYYFTPKSGISIDARSIMTVTALITLICLVILIFIIVIFSKTFVKRITKLNKKMMIVENGNLKIDVWSDSKDEIGELTNRFGKMLNNINILIEEVYQGKITQKEAELRALQTQINPHFLYNTLSIINWKALEIDATEISEIVTTVSRFYRTVLNKGKSSILVENELENAKAYMHIQLIMHSNSFDFVCDVDEKMKLHYIINLVFQPILENALEHGIDIIKGSDRRGKITLKGYFKDNNLEFYIEDNGYGMSKEIIKDVLETNSKGYGLKNVHDRIQILYGNSYGLRIESVIGEYTRIYLTFPDKEY